MGRWCEEENAKCGWRTAEEDERAGRFGFSGQCCVGVFLAVFIFYLFFCLFICLLVCFPCVLSWMKCLVFLYSARRHGGLKAKRILHCLSATLICCFSLAIYSFYCFGRLNSPPPTPPPLSHTCLSLTLPFFLFVIWQLHY